MNVVERQEALGRERHFTTCYDTCGAESGFLHLGVTDIWGWVGLRCGGLGGLVHGRMFSDTPASTR